MIHLDLEPPTEHRCDCCGGVTVSLTRFVQGEEETLGAYYARFGRDHPDRVVEALVSIGPWGEGTGPWDRVAFPLRVWVDGDQYQVGLVDAAESPWGDVQIFGRILDRAEALEDVRVKEVFHIADHMVVEDPPLHDYLNGAV
jgi:hypothetical protein